MKNMIDIRCKMLRYIHLKTLKKRLKNKNFTIICNNCLGGFIYHDLGCQFLSPTINLFFSTDDFILFAKNLKYYINCELVEYIDKNKDYPLGILKSKDKNHKDVILNFQHYKNFNEAKEKWETRCKRINFENICIIMEFYDDVYDEKLLYDFQEIPYKSKIVITHKPYNNIKNTFAVSCYENNMPRGKLFEINKKTGKRYLDDFDYVKFINNITRNCYSKRKD